MELKEFIRETLVQIAVAIKEAQAASAETGAIICPRHSGMFGATKDVMHTESGIIETVSFDVAVSTTEGTETKGGIGIFVAPLALGLQGKSAQQNLCVSRIQFSVRISLPSGR